MSKNECSLSLANRASHIHNYFWPRGPGAVTSAEQIAILLDARLDKPHELIHQRVNHFRRVMITEAEPQQRFAFRHGWRTDPGHEEAGVAQPGGEAHRFVDGAD